MSSVFDRQQLVGRWYRADVLTDGRRYCELAQLYDDGQFEFNFVTYALDGQVSEDVSEYGLWGLVANVHFTITQADSIGSGPTCEADMRHADNYHAYQVLKLTNNEFHYQHLSSGETFVMLRIQEE